MNASTQINYIEKQTGVDPTHTVIWLHGLGADGHDFADVVTELRLPSNSAVRFIFPHAPKRPITINGKMVMRGWYDIIEMPIHFETSTTDMTHGRAQDSQGIECASNIIQTLIRQENQRGIKTAHIFLAGFSQGGAIALYTGLRLQQKLAGILALSSYLLDPSATEKARQKANQNTSVFFAHGIQDPVIPLEIAKMSKDKLIEWGYDVLWRTYPMPHSTHPDEITEISHFLSERLSYD